MEKQSDRTENQKKGDPKKAGLGYTIGNYLIRGIGFLTLPIFARLLSTEDFGLFNTFSSYESILFVIVGIALHTSFKNAYIKFKGEFRNYAADCTALCLGVSAVFLIGGLILTRMTEWSGQYICMLVLGSAATAIIAYYNAYIGIYYKAGSYLKIAGLNAIANVVVSLIMILTVCGNDRGMGRIYGKTLPIIVIAIYLIWKLWKSNPPRFDKRFITFALGFSLPLVPHGLSQVILSSSDRIMISQMIGNSETGIYSFAYTMSAIVSVTYSSLDQVWSPWFYEAFRERRYEDIKKKADIYLSMMSLLTIFVMLICPEATLILGSARYEGAVSLAVPVILGGYFSFIYNYAAIIEYFHEKTKYIAIGTILAALINVVLNFFCIRRWGYAAAAYTTVATYFLYFIFHSLIARRILAGKRIYRIRNFTGLILGVILSGVLTQICLKNPYIRWAAAAFVALSGIGIGERVFHLSAIVRHKMDRERGGIL